MRVREFLGTPRSDVSLLRVTWLWMFCAVWSPQYDGGKKEWYRHKKAWDSGSPRLSMVFRLLALPSGMDKQSSDRPTQWCICTTPLLSAYRVHRQQGTWIYTRWDASRKWHLSSSQILREFEYQKIRRLWNVFFMYVSLPALPRGQAGRWDKISGFYWYTYPCGAFFHVSLFLKTG